MTTNNVNFDTMNADELRAALAASQQENARLKTVQKGGKGGLAMKVSPKGAISVYGLGSFPVPLYEPAWMKLVENIDEVKAFIVKAEAEGLLPNEEQVAAGKAAAKIEREKRIAAKKAIEA